MFDKSEVAPSFNADEMWVIELDIVNDDTGHGGVFEGRGPTRKSAMAEALLKAVEGAPEPTQDQQP